MLRFIKPILCLSGLLVALSMPVSWALACQKAQPVAQMRCVADNLLAALKKNQANLGQSRVVNSIINQKIVPYFDVNTMAKSVVGRRFWFQASSAQRSEFIRRFKRLVINTYAAAIEKYNGDIVKFYPMRQNSAYSIVTVKSIIERPSGQKIPVTYFMRKKGGHWKVFDFSIENISMVQSYRSQLSGDLHSGGLALVNRKLG